MKTIKKHILFPASVTILFFTIASIPVDLFGCRNRGMIAALIALAGGLFGLAAAVRAVIGKARGERDSHLWVTSALN